MENLTNEEFDQVLDVFASPGWSLIIRDIEETYQNLNDVRNIQSNEQLWQVQAELRRLAWFTNLKDWYQAAQDNQDAEI